MYCLIIENDIEIIKSNTQQDLTNLIEGYEKDRIIFEDALLGFARKYTELEENMKALIKSSETKMVGLENAINKLSGAIYNNKSKKYSNYAYLIENTLNEQNNNSLSKERMIKAWEKNSDNDNVEIDLESIKNLL